MPAVQAYDVRPGFYYLRARYYDPSTGQFISRDPMVALTRQPYAYVGNNPLNATDPTGNGPEGFAACLSLIIPVVGEGACAIGATEAVVTTVGVAAVGWLLMNSSKLSPHVTWEFPPEGGQTWTYGGRGSGGGGSPRCGPLCKRLAIGTGAAIGAGALYGDLEDPNTPAPMPGPSPSCSPSPQASSSPESYGPYAPSPSPGP